MDQGDAGNPYRAPEASIAALRLEIRRPPVYSAISLLCWALGAFHLIGSGFLIFVLARNTTRFGWESGLRLGGGPLILLVIALDLATTLCYLGAAQWLRHNRGRPGLIACVVGIGMTFLIQWLIKR